MDSRSPQKPSPWAHVATVAAVAAGIALGLVPPATAAPAVGVDEIAVGTGISGVLDNDTTSEASVEVRFGRFSIPHLPRWLRLQPIAGAMVNGAGGGIAYAGARLPFELGKRWTVAAYSGIGLYERAGGKELGGAFEFRSGLEAAVRVGARSQVGATFYHLSNAGIYDPNPGIESLELVYTVRFGR